MIWDDLRIIAAVRDGGTFASAARILGIDETTVARRLNRIQATLGITLFDAVDGIRKPTGQCRTILSHIDEMTREAAKISNISTDQTHLTGNIRVAATPSIAETLLSPTLGEFLITNPGLSLELNTSSENVNFSRWEADLAIRLGKPEKGAFIVRKLAEIRLYLFRPVNKETPENSNLICAYPDDLNNTAETKELKSQGLLDATRLKTSNVQVIRSVIQSHSGIGILPEYLAKDLMQDENLTATPLKSSREVWLLIQPHLKKDEATRAVINWIEASLAPLST